MLSKLAIVLKGKMAAAVIGLLVVGGSGTAVAVAAKTQTGPFANTHASVAATETAKDNGQSGTNHAHTVAIEGVLKAYNSTAKTIGVQKNGETSTTTISVNDQTTVNGAQATSLTELTKSLNHTVQVQADRQSDGSLLAWKITVGGEANPNAGNGSGSTGDTGQRPVVGTVSSVDSAAKSFVLKEADGTTVTVTVSSATQFQGSVHSLADLKVNAHVTVKGTKQSDGTIAATSLQIGDGTGA